MKHISLNYIMYICPGAMVNTFRERRIYLKDIIAWYMDPDRCAGRNRVEGNNMVQGRVESLILNNTFTAKGDIP
jgi:hypothetical protein